MSFEYYNLRPIAFQKSSANCCDFSEINNVALLYIINVSVAIIHKYIEN